MAREMNMKMQLRFYLKSKGMTASQLGKMARVPRQSISDWLAGSSPRNVNHVKKVADALGVSVDNLLFGEGVDPGQQRVTELDALLGEGWVSGLFEVRFRRIKR